MSLPDLARSRAILIGNSTYSDPGIPDLPGAQAGVQAMTDLLTSPLCDWPADRVTPLVDLAVPSELATLVVDAVRDAEDVLLVYYVGHGIRTFDGRLALALSGTRAHPEALPHTAMLYPSLASILSGCRAPTKLVILDCCHAELGHQANYVFQSADPAETYPVDGLYFIGASSRDAKAKAPADGGLTYFTEAFVTTIITGIPHQPPTLRLDQIFLELRARLVRANLPEPVEAGTRGAHQYPFARNSASQELLLASDAGIARLRSELQHLREQHSRTAPATTHPTEPPHRKTPVPRRPPPTAAAPGATPPEPPGQLLPPLNKNKPVREPALRSDPAERRTGFNRRGLLSIAAVAALSASGIGGAVWALAPNASAPEPKLTQTPTRILDSPRHTNMPTPAPTGAVALGKPLTGFTTGVYSVVFSPHGHILAANSGKGVWLWNVTDPAKPTPLGPPPTGYTDTVRSVAFSPDGSILAGSVDNTIRLWNVTNPAKPTLLGSPLSATDGVTQPAFSPDGHTLAAGSGNGVRLWNVTNPARLTPLGPPLTGFTAGVNSVAFSPDSRTLAADSIDNTVRLWSVADPTKPLPLGSPLTGFTFSVFSVAFSPDGHTLAAGSLDNTIRLWNVTNPAKPTPLGSPLTGFTAGVVSVAFSPDGHTLAASSIDDTVRLWNVTNPVHPASLGSSLTGFIDIVYSVAFSPDGQTLAAGSIDGTVRLWALR